MNVTFHTNTPPPPFRGALPSAQACGRAIDRAGCAAGDHGASSARRHRCCDRAPNVVAGGLAAGSGRRRRAHAAIRLRRAGISRFRSRRRRERRWRSSRSRERRRQRNRSGKAGLARAVLARCRACGPGSRADIAERRTNIGADVGGAAGDRGAVARRRRATQPGARARPNCSPAKS